MELKINKMRNLFKPRWWQFRYRYRLWRLERDREHLLSQLDPEVREAYEKAELEAQHRVLFGDEEV